MTKQFATLLRAHMRKEKMSASDVARGVWGTKKDARGYRVARNRDYIGHYLSGYRFPTKPVLVKLANLLKFDPVDMYDIQPTPRVRKPDRRR